MTDKKTEKTEEEEMVYYPSPSFSPLKFLMSVIWLWVFIFTVFWGNPDLHDAIITFLTK